MDKYTIERVYLKDKDGNPTETLGSWYDDKRIIVCKTLELPDRGNVSSADSSIASCVMEGLYKLKKQPPKAGRDYGYFRFEYVPGRRVDPVTKMSHILVHRITYVKDLLGCVGVGGRFHDWNKDGVPDMADSSKKLQWMYENLPNEFLLEIKKKDPNNKEVNLN